MNIITYFNKILYYVTEPFYNEKSNTPSKAGF
jgi:hypothetical protein